MPPHARIAAAFHALPASVRAAIWMTFAALCFTGMNGTIRMVSDELPAFEIVFLRNLIGVGFMLPWVARNGANVLQTNRHRLYLFRALIAFTAMSCWFAGVTMMPLAEATAVSFTGPIFSTAAAAVLLGETVRIRRITAMAVGLVGVLVVLRPGFQAIGVAQMLILGNAVIGAIGAVTVKQLTRTESSSVIVTYMTLYTTPIALIPALFVWVTPSWSAMGWMLGLGLFGLTAHNAFTRAFAVADTALVMAFDYARLPFIALLGWLAFGEAPDRWTWIGSLIIIGSTIYIAQREAVLARRRREAG